MTDRTPPNTPVPEAPATLLPTLSPPLADPGEDGTVEQRTVLVIGAHPDDPDFSSAGPRPCGSLPGCASSMSSSPAATRARPTRP